MISDQFSMWNQESPIFSLSPKTRQWSGGLRRQSDNLTIELLMTTKRPLTRTTYFTTWKLVKNVNERLVHYLPENISCVNFACIETFKLRIRDMNQTNIHVGTELLVSNR